MMTFTDRKPCTKAVLLQPPPGDLTGPYPALPYLKAAAEGKGHRVKVFDTGIEAFHFLTEPERLADLLDRAQAARVDLEGRTSLTSGQQAQYSRIAGILAVGTTPGLVREAVESFKESGAFKNYRRYTRSCGWLDTFFRLLSAVHHPTSVTPSEYPTAQEINSFDGILDHCDPALNPYVSYYQEVLLPALERYAPSTVGISMEFAAQSVQALVLGRMLKERFPEIHVTMGGAYLSQWVLLMEQPQLAGFFSFTDSVVCGEGEESFTGLMDRIAAHEPLNGLANLIFRDRDTDDIRRFDRLEYPDVADLPPPDFSDLDLGAYLIPKPVIPYAVSRGCYWGKCVFCQNRYGDNRMRRYQTVPVDKALDEMFRLSDRYGTDHFNFSNDVLDPPFLKRFSEALLASGRKLVWNTDLRAEKSVSRDLCSLMARAGLNSVAIGVESACQRTLDAMDKGKSIEEVRRVMKDLYDHGVATQAMAIFGFPGEKEEEAEMTVRFLEENVDRISYYVVGLLMVLPGSRMHADPHRYGITSLSYENNDLMAPQPVWRSDNRISAAAVSRLYHSVGHLEEIFAIHEYPYVGALSTNHGFLYFRNGPDILKRLRKEENCRRLKIIKILETENEKARIKKVQSLAPKLASGVGLWRSPFPFEPESGGGQGHEGRVERLSPSSGGYLLGPVVLPVGDPELALLEKLNGERTLKSLFSGLPRGDAERAFHLLTNLVVAGLVEV
jgi:anaerobic magnesium-protoporphyrin IX monomethyl ester cyclase